MRGGFPGTSMSEHAPLLCRLSHNLSVIRPTTAMSLANLTMTLELRVAVLVVCVQGSTGVG